MHKIGYVLPAGFQDEVLAAYLNGKKEPRQP